MIALTRQEPPLYSALAACMQQNHFFCIPNNTFSKSQIQQNLLTSKLLILFLIHVLLVHSLLDPGNLEDDTRPIIKVSQKVESHFP